jgi:dihydrofolate reductase
MHVSLDGFAAAQDRALDWVKHDDEMFDLVGQFTDEADSALYGRVTYQMMEQYWPTAADQPSATKHDKEHSRWYNNVTKIVLSRSMRGNQLKNTMIVSDNVLSEIQKLKQQPGKNILIFGSPSAAHALMESNLIDDFWLFVNPIILGQGIPLFPEMKNRIKLQLLKTKEFACGVTGLHYTLDTH